MRVWVTRAEPGAAQTAERLRSLGHDPLIAPLLRVRRLTRAPIDLTGVAALTFTSVNAVSAFAAQCDDRRLPVFAVGRSTAGAARTLGFSDVRASDGDVTALAGLIQSHSATLRGYILHPGAQEPAGDLVGELELRGLQGKAVVTYTTDRADTLPGAVHETLDTVDAVLVHSPKAGAALAGLATAPPLCFSRERLQVFGLSAACVEPLRSTFVQVDCAGRPTDDALLSLLGKPTGRG